MIKLKTLLEDRSRDITFESAKKIIEENPFMKEVVSGDLSLIFRGIDNDGGESDLARVRVVRPSRHERVSRNSQNFYTTIIDSSPNWKLYPDRSKSIICSADEEVAKRYGTLYVVIPMREDAKFGVCPTEDIWTSFKWGNLSHFNSLFEKVGMKLTEAFPMMFSAFEPEDFEFESEWTETSLRDFNMHMDDLKNEMQEDQELHEYVSDIFQSFDHGSMDMFLTWLDLADGDMENILYDAFNPANNGFFLTEYYKDKAVLYDNEVWTDSDCLMIEYDFFTSFFHKHYKK